MVRSFWVRATTAVRLLGEHLYTFPRHAVLKGHSQKAFIPYDSHLKSLLSNSSNLIHHHQFQIIQAEVKQIKSNQIILNQSIHSNHPSSPSTDPLHWDYLIYALGSHLPPPLNLPNQSIRSKSNGIDFLNHQESQISKSNQILIVGGGPLGIQYATDIADHYLKKGQPKQITLIHSRLSFLPKFKPQLDLKIKSILNEYQIKLILGERVNLIKLNQDLIAKSQGIIDSIRVESIRDPNLHWNADLVLLCTGQIPNTSLMSEFCPLSVPGGKGSNQYINTHRTLQISTSSLGPSPVKIGLGQSMICECAQGMKEIEEVDHPHTFDRVFAIGDCIDGFGAIKAGHTGWNQAEVAVRNVLRLIEGEMKGDEVKLEEYQISPPMIRLTLGLDRVICQLPSESNPNEIEILNEAELIFSVFKTLTGQEVTIELKNDLAIQGTLASVDQFLNLKIENIKVLDQERYPHMMAVKNCFIRGSVVRYVQIPKNAVDTQLLEDATRKEFYLQSSSSVRKDNLKSDSESVWMKRKALRGEETRRLIRALDDHCFVL
ncbi:hypothetical protein DFH28DRAFT_1105683 [Melampsora americana]|nr:hypothetical protein DFH28DRAFT_1105683 [Melampsora americana]